MRQAGALERTQRDGEESCCCCRKPGTRRSSTGRPAAGDGRKEGKGRGGDNAERTESETRRAAILRHPHSKPPSRTTRLGSRARPPRVVLISLAQTASVRAWHLCKSSSEERNEAKGTIVQGCHANPILPADMVPTLFPIPVSLRCHAKCC